ncbi:hypothetical protein CROQUDRAFT_94601 [Cronartium quercuum f. sp. fusiforme G11]|uniref:Uncharacterized protein n=1 Tax=Cronartium quercuum f. sp. fusiforme G11 TaxID=708437 RepID=A0A9P6NEY6_9BASI|nr:hypothetical protein CROQUDRAFT_94601 [Cronartium quercuum f. sp. fusiforme G11]
MSGVQKIVVLLLAAITCVTAIGTNDDVVETRTCTLGLDHKSHQPQNFSNRRQCSAQRQLPWMGGPIVARTQFRGRVWFHTIIRVTFILFYLIPCPNHCETISTSRELDVIHAEDAILYQCQYTPGTTYINDQKNNIVKVDLWQDNSTTSCPQG